MYQSRSIVKLTIIAVSLSVLLHVSFIIFSVYKKLDGYGGYQSQHFVEKVAQVEFIPEEELPQEMLNEQDPGEQEKVSNIDFNTEHKREHSEDPYSSKTEKEIEEQVEKELREFEAQEFAKYKKEKLDVITDKNKTTNDGLNTQETETEKTKTSNTHAGAVAAEWYLPQRDSEKLFKPSYVCKGGGKVKVNVIVDREGLVVEAVIDKKGSNYKEACMGENALIYAKRCRFNISTVAPERLEGWITYTYIPQ